MNEFIICAILVVLTTITFASKQRPENSATSILNFIKVHDSDFHIGVQKDIVLVLGITDSGASTLTALITGVELESIEMDNSQNGYCIVDTNEEFCKINGTTIIPNLMIDEQNGVSFYDCPAFGYSRGVKEDLTTSFTTEKLLDFAESVKFLFTISYSSFEVDNGDGLGFLDLVRYATTMIKDIEKYRDGIALVVTRISMADGESDADKIEIVASFLRLIKENLESEIPKELASGEEPASKQKIQFIDILLEKNENGYARIRVLRHPDMAGPLSEMPLIQNEKASILNMVSKNLRYIQKESNDFRFTISNNTKVCIDDVVDGLKDKLIADFNTINSDIKRFILQKEKLSAGSVNKSMGALSMINGNLSEIISMEPTKFVKQLTHVVDTLDISVSSRIFNRFCNYVDFLDFVQLFSKNNFMMPIEILNQIADQRAYLNESQLWYNFMIDLSDKLSKYRVQQQSKNFDGNRILNLEINDQNEDKMVSALDIQSQLDHVDPEIYPKIQYLHVNTYKLKLLQGIWSQSMLPITKDCSSDGNLLIVKGFNVLISDILDSECWSNAAHIEIFAMNKVFLDADIKRPSIYLSIISPAWEIVLNNGASNRQINLRGADSPNYNSSAREGISYPNVNETRKNVKYPEKGENGMAGVRGGSGGNFFGIGWSINDNQLVLNVNGGDGGNGQDGGNGLDGKDGDEPPKTTDIHHLTKQGFKCGNISEENIGSMFSIKYTTKIHHFCGKPANPGTDGGDGGCKGYAGSPGESQIFGLENQTNIIISKVNGMSGKDGKGGLGGKGAKNGRNLHVKIEYALGDVDVDAIWNPESSRSLWYEETGFQPGGANGSDGTNSYEFEPKTYESYNILESLHRYKYYAREHLAANNQVSDLKAFLVYLSGNKEINSLFSTSDLIIEFENLDNHYFKLRDKFSFIPHYESLRARIIEHSQTLTGKKEEEKTINFLYTAVLSRLFAIKSNSNHIGVVNLLEYMKMIELRMTKLQQIKRTNYINEYRNEYKSFLDSKIECATKLIQKVVVPRINMMFNEVGENIKELLNETFAMEDKMEIETKKAKENRKILKAQMVARPILRSLKMVGSMLLGLGPVGMIAGNIIGYGSNFTEKVINSTIKMHSITVPAGLIKENVFRVADQAKRDFELLKMQLSDLNAILQNESLSYFEPIERTVENSMIRLEKIIESNEMPSRDKFELLDETRKNLTRLIDNAKISLENREDKESLIILFAMKSLKFMKKILKVGEAGFEVYEQIRNDRKKISEVDDIIQTLDDQLEVLHQHEQNVYNVMIPQFKMVEQSMNEALKNSAGKSHVELVISNWTVQDSLERVKKLFNVMAEDFSAQKDLERCFEDIIKGITIAIDAYDHVDSYTEKAQLSILMADIAIGSTEVRDPMYKTAISKIETIINSNLIMEQYEEAMHALKQHKFPFAEQYLGQFELPSNSSATDAAFTSRAIDQIQDLIIKIRESNSLIETIDGYLYSNCSFTDDGAFYKWDYYNYKEEIADLLEGEEVTFYADINHGLKLNAIKFNEVWLKFKLKTQTMQNEFEAQLQQFSVVMQMMGNSFYRCDKRIYYFSLDKPFRISFSLQHDTISKPNQVFNKLKMGDPFLSPYSTWRISLESKNNNEMDYETLNRFKPHIVEVRLEGRGKYLDNKGDVVYETCNDHLDKYYRLDDIEHISHK